jgi:hypothetical protein
MNVLEFLSSIVSFVLGFITAAFAEPFQRWLARPRITLGFHREVGQGSRYISQTPERFEDANMGAFYVRGSAVNQNRTIAKSCKVFLTLIEREGSSSRDEILHQDPIPLAWSFLGPIALDLPPKLPFFFDIVSVNNVENELTPQTTPKAVIWKTILKPPGGYRLTATLTGENIDPVSFWITLEWQGTFESFSEKSIKEWGQR